MKIIHDERAVTVTTETILLFSITVLLLGMVVISFQSINKQATETVMREQYGSIGNDIASKILDLDNEIKASLSQGSVVSIENELNLRPTVANTPYSVELDNGKVILKSLGSPYVTVEVPFNPDINVVPGSTIYSTAGEYVLMYDPNGQIMFKDGNEEATVDNTWPEIAITDPPDMEKLEDTETIYVDTWDDVEVTRVEYFIDQNFETSLGDPFDWEWNTRAISDGTYTITAMAYDRAGHYSYDTRTFIVDNSLDLEPPSAEAVSPLITTDFNPPPIEVIVRDNIAIDKDTIELWLDKGTAAERNVTANSTITNTSLLEYNVKYFPSEPLSVDDHTVYVYAEEMYYGKGDPLNKNVTLNWTFSITSISDNTEPEVLMNFPSNYLAQQTGDNIRVTYRALDNDSGIDHIKINVSDGTDEYTHAEKVSIYPNVKKTVSSTWTFKSCCYILNKSYTYNVTVYDRAGNSKSSLTGPFKVITGQSDEIIIDTNDTSIESTEKDFVTFAVRSSGPEIDIVGMNISFTSGNTLEQIKFDDKKYFEGPSQPSPARVTWPPYRIYTSNTYVTIAFEDGLSTNPKVKIIFEDQTSTTVTIQAKP